jgi:hypothetical protein
MTYSVLPYSIQEKNSMHRHAHAFQKKWFPFQSLLSSPAIGLVPLFCVESTVGGSSRYRSTVFPCSRQVGGKRDKRKSRRFFSISSKNARSPDGTTSSSIYQLRYGVTTTLSFSILGFSFIKPRTNVLLILIAHDMIGVVR